jgi:hypothetical protein
LLEGYPPAAAGQQTAFGTVGGSVESPKTVIPRGHVDHARNLCTILHDAYGMRAADEHTLNKIACRWLKAEDCRLEKLLKSGYATLHNLMTGQELPEWPSMKLPFTGMFPGRVGRFLSQLIKNSERKRAGNRSARARVLDKAQTLLFAKKSAPPPVPEMRFETARKHRATLGSSLGAHKTERGSWEDVGTASQLQAADESAVLGYCSKIVEEVFPEGFLETLGGKGRLMSFPSINGHFGFDRACGGAGAEVGIHWALCLHRSRAGIELDRMAFHPHLGVLVSYRNPDVDYLMASSLKWRLEQLGRTWYPCTASFVLEPLKVRAVTAGPPVPYYLLREVQRRSWRYLSAHPAFHLVGAPVTAEYLSSRLPPCVGDQAYTSGDYEAATDNFRKFLSERIWKKLAAWGHLPTWLREPGRKALVDHEIHYTPEYGLDPVVQENGQLMGSILSFIVLCIANGGICWAAMNPLPSEVDYCPVPKGTDWADLPGEETLEDWNSQTLAELPIVINGDDCVMNYTPTQEARWRKLGALMGLKPSIGKCYRSNEWLQVNSLAFFRKEEGFARSAYLNFGLLSPNRARGADRRHFTELESLAREFLQGHNPKNYPKLMSLFLKRHSAPGGLLSDAPVGISWWLPRHLGGLGIPFHPHRDCSPVIFFSRSGKEVFVASQEASSPEPEVTGKQLLLSTWLMNSFWGPSPQRAFPGLAGEELPPWVRKALLRDGKHEVTMTQSEFLQGLDPECRDEVSLAQWLKTTKVLGPYTSALWEQAQCSLSGIEGGWSGGSDVRSRKAGDAWQSTHERICSHWYRNWRRCKSEGGTAPLSVLLANEPVVHTYPAALSRCLAQVRNGPRGLHSRISALYDYSVQEDWEDEMKSLETEAEEFLSVN